MIEELIPYIGLSIQDLKVVKLFKDWKVDYPKKITCTPNNDGLRCKLRKDGIIPSFGIGKYSRYFLPIPLGNKGSYIAQFIMIEVTNKFQGKIPFDISYQSSHEELTTTLGPSKIIKFVGETIIWRQNITPKHEIVVSDYTPIGGKTNRSIIIQYIFEENK